MTRFEPEYSGIESDRFVNCPCSGFVSYNVCDLYQSMQQYLAGNPFTLSDIQSTNLSFFVSRGHQGLFTHKARVICFFVFDANDSFEGNSVTRSGNFFKFLATIFLTKVDQIFGNFGG